MSRAEQLAKFLEEGDSKVLAELSRAIASLEQSIDQRFEAFDEVIQSLGDSIEDLMAEKDEPEKPDEEDKALAELKADIKRLSSQVSNIKLPEQKIVDLAPLQKDVNMLKLGLANAIKNQANLEASLKELKKEMGTLLTAKRVPVFDEYGNVIAVKLEA